MFKKLTSSDKRLLVIVTVGVVILVIAFFNSQAWHLISVKRHIAKVEPQWVEFRAKHPGFEDIRFFAYTGGGGMFGAVGKVDSQEKKQELEAFMESTHPPRPARAVFVQVVAPGVDAR